MSVNRNDVFMFLFENMSASIDAVAVEFDISYKEADELLQEMADDSDAIVEKNEIWRVRNWDDIADDDAAQSIAREAFGSPSAPETDTLKLATLMSGPEYFDDPRASERVPSYPHVDRARDNFGDLAENAPTESGRRFWQAKFDALPAS